MRADRQTAYATIDGQGWSRDCRIESHPMRGNMRPPIPRSRTVWFGGVAVALLIVALILVWILAGKSVPTGLGPEPSVASTTSHPTATASGCISVDAVTSTNPQMRDATATGEFDGWSVGYLHEGSQLTYSATSTNHGGLTALQVSGDSNLPSEEVFAQGLSLVENASYSLDFWVRTDDAVSGDISLAIGPTNNEQLIALAVTGGGWRQVSSTYTVPAGFSATNLQIRVQAIAGAVQIDDIALRGPDGIDVVANGGFESNSAILSLANTSLMFSADASGEGKRLDLQSQLSSPYEVAWCIEAPDGTFLHTGEGRSDENGRVSIEIPDMAIGLYKVRIATRVNEHVVERSAMFAITAVEEDDQLNRAVGFSGHLTGSPERMTALPELIASIGFGGMRVEISWDRSEVTAGDYDYPAYIMDAMAAYAAAGVPVLMVPAYYNPIYDGGLTPSTPEGIGAYARFAADVAATFDADGNALEVYNEFDHTFNTGRCGRTPDCYLEFLNATRDAVKAVEPAMPVAGPATAGMGVRLDWLIPFLELGGANLVDAVTFHPYSSPASPATLLGDLEELHARIGGDSEMWLTEIGWPVMEGVTAEQQRDYTAQMLAISSSLQLDRTYLFTVADLDPDGTGIPTGFGLFLYPTSFTPNTYQPKPSALAASAAANLLSGFEGNGVTRAADGHYEALLKGAGGEKARVLWVDDSVNGVTVDLPQDAEVLDIYGARIDRRDAVPLTTSPIYVIENGR